MKIDVYDTYGESKQGELIHFDVFIESGVAADKAYQYAMRYKGLSALI
ncbi:DUF2024 family protein [Agarilytica rhodophyticola]|nr:DUF2024 family protein [Agarilytica rhodophyticola]